MKTVTRTVTLLVLLTVCLGACGKITGEGISLAPKLPTLTISLSAPSFSYVAGAIVDITPALGQSVASVSISPALPSGLSISPTTGVITGVATGTLNPTIYTLTATNSRGNTTTVSFSLSISNSISNSPPTLNFATAAWTWMSGSNTTLQAANFGTKGSTAPSNIPSARYDSASTIDLAGNLWLFGGLVTGLGAMNDLWKWDGSNWTWVSGSNTANDVGTYGTKGVTNASNVPPARYQANLWTDPSGNFWLFGGFLGSGPINDLWRWNGSNWTWISGRNTPYETSNYGTKGVAAPANVPGARSEGVSWVDPSGNFWIFGGNGYDATNLGLLNDLWKWNGTYWTWVSGSNTRDQAGTYGTKGVADPANTPGARRNSVAWIDSSANLWLFGGSGRDSAGTSGSLNDLCKWDGSNWTWVSGSNTVNQTGVYGTKGTAAATNVPGARNNSISWVDVAGNLWLFGGSVSGMGIANDLWKWDGSNWTWMSGNNTGNQLGIYGTKGSSDPSNMPGGRHSSISWRDSTGALWLFGGSGYGSSGGAASLNDLWKFY